MKISTKNTEFILFALSFILLSFVFFFRLGNYPLYLEEPRRALIALEMLFNKNFIVPTEFGEFYYNKPPLWNWVIIFSFKLFGNFSEFAVRFFSVLSLLLSGVLIFLMGKKYVGLKFGMISCMFYLISSDILFYYSFLGEIDLFFSFLILLAFFSLFHFYHSEKIFISFVLFYTFIALGILTKGMPALAFGGITILAFLIYLKQFKTLFGYKHLLAFSILPITVFSYFIFYSKYNSPGDYLFQLLNESGDKTLAANNAGKFFIHLILFPLETLKNILPATLLIFFLIRKSAMDLLLKNTFIRFCIIILLTNYILYWLSPGARQRYIYMLYPLLINSILFGYFSVQKEKWAEKLLNVIFLILPLFLFIAFVSLNFFHQFSNIKQLFSLSISGSVLALLILWLYFKYKEYKLWTIVFLFILIRISYVIIAIPSFSKHELPEQMKMHAEKIVKLTSNIPPKLYKDIIISRTTAFYIEKNTRCVLGKTDNIENEKYLITLKDQEIDKSYKVLYEFENDNDSGYRLIEIVNELH